MVLWMGRIKFIKVFMVGLSVADNGGGRLCGFALSIVRLKENHSPCAETLQIRQRRAGI